MSAGGVRFLKLADLANPAFRRRYNQAVRLMFLVRWPLALNRSDRQSVSPSNVLNAPRGIVTRRRLRPLGTLDQTLSYGLGALKLLTVKFDQEHSRVKRWFAVLVHRSIAVIAAPDQTGSESAGGLVSVLAAHKGTG